MRIATIDVGTNTAMLLVADVAADGTLRPVLEDGRFVRLGEGVDRTGRVGEAAIGRLLDTLRAYRDIVRAHEVDDVVVGATSASRDAANRDDIVAAVRQATGWTYEILTGEDEAAWSFQGALSAFDDLTGSCVVMDIGGGSTELALGEAGGALHRRCSLQVGSVRLTERYFGPLPPRAEDVARAEAYVRHSLRASGFGHTPGVPFVSASETPLYLALVDRQAASWKELNGPVSLHADEVRAWRRRLIGMAADEVLALHPGVLNGRADLFPAAVLIFDTVMHHFGFSECRVSPRSLRHGLALRYMENGRSG